MEPQNKALQFKLSPKIAAAIAGGLIVVLILFKFVFGGSGDNLAPAVKLKNINNRYQASITVIEDYSKDVRSSSLKSMLSETATILTAGKNSTDKKIKDLGSTYSKAKSTVSSKTGKEDIQKLEDAKNSNNLDSTLKAQILKDLNKIYEDLSSLRDIAPPELKLSGYIDQAQNDLRSLNKRIESARV